MVSKGANVNGDKDLRGRTPLFFGNSKEITKFLIDHGAEVNAKDEFGQTPLHRSCRYGLKDRIEILIAAGANVNTKDNEGNTPLSLARERGHTEIVELLKKHGAKE